MRGWGSNHDQSMTKTIPTVVTGLSVTAVVLLTGAYAHASTSSSTASRSASTSNTAALCPVIVRVGNLESNRVGNMRPGPAQNKAWADYTTSTRALAAVATDPSLKKDLNRVAEGMARISAEPGRDLDHRSDHLAKHDPTYNASLDAASDRLEATCGPITGQL